MSRTPIELPLPQADGRLYHDPATDTVFAQLPNPCSYCHAADLLELPCGDLLCCWFAGQKGEGYSDVSVYLSRLDAGSSQWSEPIRVSDDMTRSEQNPSLFLAPDGAVWCVYPSFQSKVHELAAHCNLQYTSRIVCKKSLDGGRTWGETELLFDGPGAFCRQKIQVLRSGRWIFGNWLCFDDDTRNGSDVTVLRISDDEGCTWRTVEVPDSRGCVHVNVVEREAGKLIGFFRSRGADRIYMARSEDDGSTWTRPEPTELPNNNAGISAIGLRSGSIAVAYDSCSFSEDRLCSRWPRQRAPLAVALTDSEGRSFDFRRMVDMGGGYFGRRNGSASCRCEYPVLLESRDGQHIYLAYTWNNRRAIRFMVISEGWIRGAVDKDEGLITID
ncbi:MAG: exo-alpha-sialidase [Aristaeellaceae bacterium]